MHRTDNKIFGDIGENTAVKYLRQQGYKILERNFRLKSGEIDIIAMDGRELVFIEVKTRRSFNQEFLLSSINKDKEIKLNKVASCYLEQEKYHNLTGRFDIVFIIAGNGEVNIEHIKDAFTV